ncbi:MAG TPA: sugar MFS transporter [Cyclobacteriaceae bacterium]
MTSASSPDAKKQYLISITIIAMMFFIFGFVTWTNGTLIPYLKIACQLESDFQAYLVATAFFIAYTVMAIPSSILLKKTGYKKGMFIGLCVMAGGALFFIPAAQARNFNMFLAALFILASGLALLQTASNPYATIIGPIESAATRISIMGICNKVAGIIATWIFGSIALKDADSLIENLKTMDAVTKAATLDELASRVILPYAITAAVLIVFAVIILFSSLPDLNDEGEESTVTDNKQKKTSVFQYPYLVLGVITLFLYVGAEVIAGDTIISYGKSLGIEFAYARYFTIATLVCMLLGYIVGIFLIPKYLSQGTALRICAILGIGFTILAVLTSGYVSVAFIALLGLANSLIWPAMWPLAIGGLGKFTKIGSALMIMAIAGGAIIPLIYGKLTESVGTQQAYWVMLPCYLFILFYAVKGHKIGKA